MIDRKDKPIAHTFGSGFAVAEALDAVADVYTSVIYLTSIQVRVAAYIVLVRLLVNADLAWSYRLV